MSAICKCVLCPYSLSAVWVHSMVFLVDYIKIFIKTLFIKQTIWVQVENPYISHHLLNIFPSPLNRASPSCLKLQGFSAAAALMLPAL